MDDYNNVGNADYLDEIAPKVATKTSLFANKKMMILIGAGVGVLILSLVLFSVAGNRSNKNKAPSEALYIRMSNLQSFTSVKQSKDWCRRVKNAGLRGICRDINTYMLQATKDYGTQLPKVGASVDSKAMDQTTRSREIKALEGFSEAMRDAELSSSIDRIYADQIMYYLTLVMQQIKRVYNGASSAKYKQMLEKTSEELMIYHNRLETFINNGYSMQPRSSATP